MKTELIKITELKKDDIFSFRTVMKPIYFRFIEVKQGIIIYEEIKSKFKHTSQISLTIVRRQVK
jgi:hypothetical protein